ncbi:hypothetical protein EHQ12_00700 [Leptospira gomenensis]|nr:hypothetical protein [Leptospira gomenensis]TGK45082.1 hypothetical protein EHQ12_00700 [Leptospira gomenensis]
MNFEISATFRRLARVAVVVVLTSQALFADHSSPSDEIQPELRERKRIYLGGFGIRELSWFQVGYNLSPRFSLSFSFHQRHKANHFDLDRTGFPPGGTSFSLRNLDFTLNQYTIALEWFPFSNPYFLSVGLGQESYFQRDTKNEFSVYSDGSADGRAWTYSIDNRRFFLAPGAGLRYVFSSGLYLNGGFSVLFFLNDSGRVHRENFAFYGQRPDPVVSERLWKDGKEQERDRARGIGVQLFLSAGISI